MNRHHITYEVIEAATGTRFRATCRCGARRDARSAWGASAWGPEHVVSAWEREQRTKKSA